MSDPDGSTSALWGVLAVLALVAANGFFVAAEFSLVAIRRSRVVELVESGSSNARALLAAVDRLDANLAATQLGITISSLGLGWIGEPALARLIEPALQLLPEAWAAAGAHAISVVVSFILITSLHIVLGELAPKSLALQRSELTALWVVRPLGLFLLVLRPAIGALNGLGNLVLRLCGLQPGAGEGSLHSAGELKLLVQESQEAGILPQTQQEVVSRVLDIGDRRVGDIMTPRPDLDWIDVNGDVQEQRHAVRGCRHGQLLVGRGDLDDILGVVMKKDLLDQLLDGGPLDIRGAIQEPLLVHESSTIFRVLEQFKRTPVRVAVIVNEYGSIEGVVTQTDLLEALAGELPDSAGESPDIDKQEDGSHLIDGLTSLHEALAFLDVELPPDLHGNVHTVAGLALHEFSRIPEVGDTVVIGRWTLEVVRMEGRRIETLRATRNPDGEA